MLEPHAFDVDALHFEPLPSPNALKQLLPITLEQEKFILHSRRQICDILHGNDPRLLLIVGPCSIHDPTAALEYASKLHSLATSVSSSFFIVMRAYFEKPRTTLGWKGLLYDPLIDRSHDIVKGLYQTRSLLLSLASMGIPSATEFLEPIASRYFSDLISWGCIGARTTESQIHRQLASGLSMPIAFKNSTSGNIDVAIKGVIAASIPHATFGIDDEGHVAIVRTAGNPLAHVMLRGGDNSPNYDTDTLALVLHKLHQVDLPQRVLIDCSHANSLGNHEAQPSVFAAVLQQHLKGNKAIRGMALESHLFAGNQYIPNDPKLLNYGISLTDPCLDWTETEALIQWGANVMQQSL